MTQTKTAFKTPNASKYLQQLCKHFGHKVRVEFSPINGVIDLPYGRCKLAANDDHLAIEGQAEAAKIGQLEQMMASHLARFAFRENPTLTWQRAA